MKLLVLTLALIPNIILSNYGQPSLTLTPHYNPTPHLQYLALAISPSSTNPAFYTPLASFPTLHHPIPFLVNLTITLTAYCTTEPATQRISTPCINPLKIKKSENHIDNSLIYKRNHSKRLNKRFY